MPCVYFGLFRPCRAASARIRDSLADVFCYVARPPSVQFEISRYLYRQRERAVCRLR